MSRYSWSSRDTVEECKCLDIFWLRQQRFLLYPQNGTLKWTRGSGEVNGSIGFEVHLDPDFESQNYIRLIYTCSNRFSEQKKDLDYKIKLVKTPCYFGGFRYWFICPLVVNGIPCERRVAKLYAGVRGEYFGCRYCYNLTFRSCKEHDSRVNALMKYPFSGLKRALESKDPQKSLLGIKAWTKMMNKFKQ
jgi:hypothetical protein